MSAFAFNKPVIATNVGGLSEMVKDKVFGEIISPRDVESITKSIIKLISDEKLLNEYSNNIQMHYQQSSDSWSNIAKSLIDEISIRYC